MKKYVLLGMFALSFSSLAISTKECVAKFPSIKSVILAAEPLQNAAAGKSKLKFKDLVAKAKALESLANKKSQAIQSLGCAEILNDIAPCLKPVDWSCEGIPFTVDFDFLTSVKKSTIEEQAFLSYQLYKSSNLFEVCCGDFGCEKGGVGMPNVIFEKNRMQALIQLAIGSGEYSDIAFKSLQLSSDGLKSAKCSCQPPEAPEIEKVSKEMSEAIKGLPTKNKKTKPVTALIQSMAGSLSSSFAKEACNIPGE